MKFNEKIVELRKKQGLSQEALGEKLNVARQTVSKWELGETTPEMDKLVKMSEIFQVSVDELVKGEGVIGEEENLNNTNTQKLAGLVIKILKGIGIFLIVCIMLIILLTVLGFASFNGLKVNTESQVEVIEKFVEDENM